MKRTPKWWHIDWVELGCRGWDIDVTGAGLGEDGSHAWQYAHLDRDTLHLVVSGSPTFVAQAMTDLVAAKLFGIAEENNVWRATLDCTGYGAYQSTCWTGDSTTGNSGHSLKLVA